MSNLETMPISTDMLVAFIKVAERLSVSRAAADLGLGKSLVSKRVALLEQTVAATLFSRSTRRVALTPAGEVYLEFAKRALAEISGGEERLRAMRSELTGRIRLTAPVSWGQSVLSKVLPDFLRLHPAIEIDLTLADRMMDIAVERIDMALRWSTASTQELSAEPVARVGWVMTAAPSYLASMGEPNLPSELTAHNCLSYWRETSDDQWILQRGVQRAAIRVHGRYHVDNAQALVDAALAGLGIALLPDYLCIDALGDGRLVRLLPAWEPQTKFGNVINAVAAPERMQLIRNQMLLAFLRTRLMPVEDATQARA